MSAYKGSFASGGRLTVTFGPDLEQEIQKYADNQGVRPQVVVRELCRVAMGEEAAQALTTERARSINSDLKAYAFQRLGKFFKDLADELGEVHQKALNGEISIRDLME